jgi:twitching motility protein PilT
VDLNRLCRFAVQQNASDIHLQVGSTPIMRIGGQMRAVEGDPLAAEPLREFIASISDRECSAALDAAMVEGFDFSYMMPEAARFRCSAFRHLGRIGIVLRIIRMQVPPFEELHLPTVVRDISMAHRGLVLVTGTTGSGKSTTLASMIDLINSSRRCKILTIEDPVEYVHVSKKALISQLEIGTDTPSFAQALRQALRQDPDVILVGELRDVESLRICLHAADTGHQVFSTVHSANASQTIERIIAMFPPAEHKLLLSQLAEAIEAIISQRLVTTIDGARRPAVEVLRGSAPTEKFILEGRLTELRDYIKTGESNMQTFDQHLLKMYQAELITGTEALRWATNPEALSMGMRGIKCVSR